MEFLIEPVPPFRLGLTVWALRRRGNNVVDRWDGQTYRRALQVGRRAVEIAVSQVESQETPLLKVVAAGLRREPGRKETLAAALERMLGLRVDLTDFYRLAAADERLAPLAQRFRGLKPPRFPTIVEALVNGIACQQVSLDVGIMLLNRLAIGFGARAGASFAFPSARHLAGQEPDRLRNLGFSGQKARAVVEVANIAYRHPMEMESLRELDDESASMRLQSLHGVGRWTSEYVLLRGLGRIHIFPGDDVGARRRLAQWLGIRGTLDYAAVGETVKSWAPFAGMVYFHLLLAGIASREKMDVPTP
jgi:DNA-3-methyladenine glycosylase II